MAKQGGDRFHGSVNNNNGGEWCSDDGGGRFSGDGGGRWSNDVRPERKWWCL